MKRTILLSLLVIILLAVVGCFVFEDEVRAYKAQWLSDFNQARESAAAAQHDLGLAFGKQQDQNGCFEKALGDIADCRSPICTIDTGNFLRACWEVSTPVSGFCEGVPAYNEEITEDEKSWARYGCWDMNNKSDGCRILMRQKQQLCESGE